MVNPEYLWTLYYEIVLISITCSSCLILTGLIEVMSHPINQKGKGVEKSWHWLHRDVWCNKPQPKYLFLLITCDFLNMLLSDISISNHEFSKYFTSYHEILKEVTCSLVFNLFEKSRSPSRTRCCNIYFGCRDEVLKLSIYLTSAAFTSITTSPSFTVSVLASLSNYDVA